MQKRFGFYIRQGTKNPLPNEIRSGLMSDTDHIRQS